MFLCMMDGMGWSLIATDMKSEGAVSKDAVGMKVGVGVGVVVAGSGLGKRREQVG